MEILPYLPIPDSQPRPMRQRALHPLIHFTYAVLGVPSWGLLWIVWLIHFGIKRHVATKRFRADYERWAAIEDVRLSIIEQNARLSALNTQVALISTTPVPVDAT